jgi:hypothetical protein
LTYDPCNGIDIGGTATETAHISGNTIKNTDSNAIYVSGSAVIENNRITDGTNVYLYYAQNTTVTGNILINTTFDAQAASAAVEQNTFVGSRVFSALGTFSRNLAYQSEVHCTFSTTLTCNDSWGSPTNYSGTCAGAVGQNGNVSVDPQFCGMPGSGNYFLQADSPCSPQNNSCGQIGALGVGCGPVKTQSATWGSIKAMYRK